MSNGLTQRGVQGGWMVPLVLLLAAVLAACGDSADGDGELGASEAGSSSTTSLETGTSQSGEEQTTTTTLTDIEVPTETSDPAFSDLEPTTRERLDDVCFSAVVEDRFIGDLEFFEMRGLTGELDFPASVTQALDEAQGDSELFVDQMKIVCDDLGWTVDGGSSEMDSGGVLVFDGETIEVDITQCFFGGQGNPLEVDLVAAGRTADGEEIFVSYVRLSEETPDAGERVLVTFGSPVTADARVVYRADLERGAFDVADPTVDSGEFDVAGEDRTVTGAFQVSC